MVTRCCGAGRAERATAAARARFCAKTAPTSLRYARSAPVQIAGSMHQELGKEVTEGLVRLGAIALRGWPPGEEVGVYSLPRFGGMVLAC